MNSSREYYDQHEVCPKCGNPHVLQTLALIINQDGDDYTNFKNTNSAECVTISVEDDSTQEGCGWKGIVHDLVRKNS